jgi:transcriptional regulator with XRE-family HTH domain
MAVPAAGNKLRAALQAKGWSYSRLAVELRRQAERDGVALPKHESLVTLITRWANNRQQPDSFYRDLLGRTLGLSESELFGDASRAADLAAGAEPWLLARALDASTVGAPSLDLLEAAVADFARRYPSAAPADLLGPVRRHYQDAVRLLAGPLRVAHRRRLSAVAGVLAGVAGSLSFDLKDQARAPAYFRVARQAAEEAEDRDLAAWALATWSLMPTYNGDTAEALRLIEAAQTAGGRELSPTRGAWLAALEAKAHAGLRDARRSAVALGRAERSLSRPGSVGNRLGTDFFDAPRLVGFQGASFLLLRQPEAARRALVDVLALRSPTDVKGRSLARLDLAAAHIQDREVEQACATIVEALSIPAAHQVDPIRRRGRAVLADLAPWDDHPAVRDLREQTRPILAS